MATSDDDIEAFTGRPQFSLRIAVARDSVDAPNNRSKWDYSLRVNNPTRTKLTHTTDDGEYTITIEGTKLRDTAVPNGVFDFQDGKEFHNIYLGTTGWIKHDANGNLTLNFAGTVKGAGIFGSSSPAGSLKADRIPGKPGTPANLKTTAIGAVDVSLAWTAATRGHANIDYYRVLYGTNPSFPAGSYKTSDSNTLTRTLRDLTPGTVYHVRVYAHNADGFGEYAKLSFTTQVAGVPKLVSVTSSTSGQAATLVMAPPGGASAASSYTIYNRLMPNGPWTQVKSGSPDTTQMVSGLTPGATYQWKVVAVFNGTPSSESNVVSEDQERLIVAPGAYFDGAFPNTTDQRYAWLSTVGKSISTASGFGPTGWTTFATAASTSGGTGSVVRSPDPVTLPGGQVVGGYGAVATFTTDATAGGFAFGTTSTAPGRAVVIPNRPYIASMYVKPSRSQRLGMSIIWFDSTGVLVGESLADPEVVLANEWTRLSVTDLAPETAAFAAVRVRDRTGEGWALWRSGDMLAADAVMLTLGTELLPYFDGSFPDDAFYQYRWTGAANASTSERTDYDRVEADPLADPDCVTLPPPPRPPYIPDECIDDTTLWVRYWSEIPATEVSDWLTVVPTFVLQTHGYIVRQVRIRVYANPFNFPIGVADTSNWCSEQIVSYIPGETIFTLDGPLQRAFAEVQGSPALPADHLLYGTGGTPASWPELSCGIAYRVSYDIPVDASVPRDGADDAFRPQVYLTNRI